MNAVLKKTTSIRIIFLCLMMVCAACRPDASASKTEEIDIPKIVQEDSRLEDKPVHFGVLAIDSAVSVNERYGPLMDYLSSQIKRPVELVILSQESQFAKVEEGTVDFITNNPLAAVQIQRLYETEFLVTHTRPKTGTKFSGLIVVSQESDITDIDDLKGKRAACVNFQTAAAGCTFQIYHLLQKGFDPYKDFKSFIENKSQDNIVLALLNSSIDVGFIRTGQLEKMVNKGLLSSLDEVRIIDIADDEFLYPHTTELYPEWPVAALSDTEPELVDQVRTALVQLSPDHSALTKLKAEGFVPAVDYSQLSRLIETLKLKSWDADTQQ